MIRNQWYAVLDSQQVRPGRVLGVRRMGEELAFWRDSQGQVHCVKDRCCHRGAALSAGCVKGDEVECPFHGLRYDGTGRVRVIPANGKNTPVPEQFRVDAYPARDAHGFIYIWWGEARPDLPEVPWFPDLDESQYIVGRAVDPWATHYSRVIENQLDVVHLPFVHYNTIGRGNRTLVNGPRTEWLDENTMRIYPANQVDDGSTPRKPEEVQPGRFYTELRFPNIWQNHIDDKVRLVAAFVPVDDEHTLLYLHFFQQFMRIPILGPLVARLAMPFNLYVAHQDRRVVQTQFPKRSALKMGEKLFQGDTPIVQYRRRREELIAAAEK